MKWAWPSLETGEDETTRLERIIAQVKAGLMSIDEARAEIGRQPWGLPLTSDPLYYTATGLLPIGIIDPTTVIPVIGALDGPTTKAVIARARQIRDDLFAKKQFSERDLLAIQLDDRALFLAEMGQDEPGLNRLIRAAFKLLGLQTYFTAGVKEVRAWTIHIGDTAPQAAGVIHGDFERGFIRAQTIAFDDYIAYKGEAGAKEAGKMRAEGKEYIVKDGDVMNFLFNV